VRGGQPSGEALTGGPGGAPGETGTTLPGDTGGGGASGVATGASAVGGRGAGTGGPGRGAPGATQGGANGPLPVGVTKDTITISAMAGFSGNYGPILNTTYDNGFGTWIDDVNAHGGIYGRRVVVNKIDNKTIQTNGSYLAVSIVGFGGADVSASDCLDRAGITTLGLNLSGWSNAWAHVYSAGDAAKQGKPMASFIRNVIGEHGKIGVIHTNDPVNNAARAGVVGEMQRLGMDVVHEETVAVNQGSFVAELSRMRTAQAATVALLVNTNEVLGILRDAKAIGYTPNWTGDFWPLDETATAARSLFDGIKATRNYASTNAPAFASYSAKAKQYGHASVVNSTTMALYGIALLAGQVLQNVGPTPSKGALGPAIEAITNYNNGITMELSFGSGVRVADVGMWPIECCNPDNTWKGLGDPRSAF
jgi:ABC-type branched-subunit amino acid transport system substrate-binding protein